MFVATISHYKIVHSLAVKYIPITKKNCIWNIEMTLVELIHYVSKCKWLLSIKLLSAACRSMLFARLNGRVVQYCQIESIGRWVITIRSICQMENTCIRLEKSSLPFDCCMSLARLSKISLL